MKRDKSRKKKGVCRRCGQSATTHFHHIFFGSKRHISESQDLVIEVCLQCHGELHHNNEASDNLKRATQAGWEMKRRENGMNQEQARLSWIAMMGKSWL